MQTAADIMARGADMQSHADFFLVRMNCSGFDTDQNCYITYTSQDEMTDELLIDGEWHSGVMQVLQFKSGAFIGAVDMSAWAADDRRETRDERRYAADLRCAP